MGATRYTRASVEYSEITSGTVLDWTQDATYMAWLRPTTAPAFTIFGVLSAWNSSADWWRLRCTDLITGNDDLILEVNGDSSGTSAEGTAVLTAGTWSHLAVVRSGNTWTVYVDGVSDISFSKDMNGTPSKFIEGNTYDPNTSGAVHTADSFDGRFGARKAWQAALTAQEIRSEMRCLAPQRLANLYEYWPAQSSANRAVGYAKGRNWTEVNTPTFEDGPPIPWGLAVLLPMAPAAGGIVGTAGYDDADAFGTGGLIKLQVTGTAGHADADAFGTGGVIALQVTGTTGHEDTDAFGTGGSISLQVTGTTGHEDTDAFGSGGLVNLQVAGAAGHDDADAFGTGGSISLQVTGATGHDDPDAFGTGGKVGEWGVTGVTGYDDPDAFGADGVLTLQVVGVVGYADPDAFGAGGQVGVGITGLAGYADPDGFGTGGGIWLFDEDTPVLPLLGSFEPVTLLGATHRTTVALIARHRPVLHLEARA